MVLRGDHLYVSDKEVRTAEYMYIYIYTHTDVKGSVGLFLGN